VGGYIVRRLLSLIPLILILSCLVFALSFLIPGDPARTLAGGLKATPERVALVRKQLGLDKPVLSQYGRWVGHVGRGDLGKSLLDNTTVFTQIRQRFPVTLSMALGGMFVTLLIGVPAGLVAGTRPGTLLDRLVTLGTSAAIAMPDFWVAMILIVVFAVKLKLLPPIGFVHFTQSPVDWLQHLYLPCIALGLGGAASIARLLRGAMVDVLEQDYIRTAGAKGLRQRTIVMKHALKNAALAPITVLGIQFAYLLGGTVVLEQIFSIPGMGQYFFNALVRKDLPVIQGVTLVVAVTFVVINLTVDVMYAYVNPKVRLG
jgi:peptide/nickel transport system permease protein